MNELADKVEETFEQKLARTQGVDQDFAEVLVENWQRVLGAFLAVLLGIWVYGEYVSAKENKVGEASKRFAQVQDTLVKLRNEKENTESLAKLFSDNVTALKTTFDGTSYSELAPLYEALSLSAQGKPELAEPKFRELLNLKKSEEYGRNDLIIELAGLALGRSLVDQQKDTEAQKIFEDLVKNSRVVNLEALLVLARLSTDKTQVETLARELKKSRPDFAEQVDRELALYGLDLGQEVVASK